MTLEATLAAAAKKNAVVCITDRNYLLPTKVMLSSLVKVLAPEIRIFVLSRDATLADFEDVDFRDRISGVVDYSKSSIFSEISQRSFRGKTHVTADAMAKLQLPFMFEDYERVLYLDGDMICCSQRINDLFTMDLGSALVAAVPDYKIARGAFCEVIDIAPQDFYFNSGLVLFEIRKCLAYLSERLVADRAATIADKVRFVDQDTLNYLYRGRVHYLDLEFNVFANVHLGGGKTLPLEDVLRSADPSFMAFSGDQLLSAMSRRVVLHYTSSSKPWKGPCGHDELWWAECDALKLGARRQLRTKPKSESNLSRSFGRFKAAVVEPRKAVTQTLVGGLVKQLRQQLDLVLRRQNELRDDLARQERQRVRVPVAFDLRWAVSERDLSIELERLFGRHDFGALAAVIVHQTFAQQMDRLASAWQCAFILEPGALAPGRYFFTPLFAAVPWQLHAELLALELERSVPCSSVGSWIRVDTGGDVHEDAQSAPLGVELLSSFPQARYDGALAELYRRADQPRAARLSRSEPGV